MGASVLLVDEDTSATNFMIRDQRMQTLVTRDKEPITPFVDKVGKLYKEFGVSTIMVMGGSGDYFDVADTVIMMDNYQPRCVTERAKEIAQSQVSQRLDEGGGRFGVVTPRKPPLVPEERIERYRSPPRVPRYRGEGPADRATPEMDARDPHARIHLVREGEALLLRIESFEAVADPLAGLEGGDGFTVERDDRTARVRIEREEALARAAAHALARVMVILDRVRPGEGELLAALRPHLEAGFHVNDVAWRGSSATAYASRGPIRQDQGGPKEARTRCFEIWIEGGHWRVTPEYTVPRWWLVVSDHTAVRLAPRRCISFAALGSIFMAGTMLSGVFLRAPFVVPLLCMLGLVASILLFAAEWKKGTLSPARHQPSIGRPEAHEEVAT